MSQRSTVMNVLATPLFNQISTWLYFLLFCPCHIPLLSLPIFFLNFLVDWLLLLRSLPCWVIVASLPCSLPYRLIVVFGIYYFRLPLLSPLSPAFAPVFAVVSVYWLWWNQFFLCCRLFIFVFLIRWLSYQAFWFAIFPLRLLRHQRSSPFGICSPLMSPLSPYYYHTDLPFIVSSFGNVISPVSIIGWLLRWNFCWKSFLFSPRWWWRGLGYDFLG